MECLGLGKGDPFAGLVVLAYRFGASLSEGQIGRLGLTLLKLEVRMEVLERTFGPTDADLRLNISDVTESGERDFFGSMERS